MRTLASRITYLGDVESARYVFETLFTVGDLGIER